MIPGIINPPTIRLLWLVWVTKKKENQHTESCFLQSIGQNIESEEDRINFALDMQVLPTELVWTSIFTGLFNGIIMLVNSSQSRIYFSVLGERWTLQQTWIWFNVSGVFHSTLWREEPLQKLKYWKACACHIQPPKNEKESIWGNVAQARGRNSITKISWPQKVWSKLFNQCASSSGGCHSSEWKEARGSPAATHRDISMMPYDSRFSIAQSLSTKAIFSCSISPPCD